jgi:hypothetical protein
MPFASLIMKLGALGCGISEEAVRCDVAKVLPLIPVWCFGGPEQIAKTVLFLARLRPLTTSGRNHFAMKEAWKAVLR